MQSILVRELEGKRIIKVMSRRMKKKKIAD